jgi:AcrR family transcriptional regulator
MRPFTQEEKEYYQRQLAEKGWLIFSKYGVKKATVEELTKAVGISKGSFYLFFESKEELFFHILTEEIAGLRQAAASLFMKTDEPYNTVRSFLGGIIGAVRLNPIVAYAVSPEGREILEREKIKKQLRGAGDIALGLEALLSALIDMGIIAPQNTKRIMNLMRTLFIVLTHREDLDEEYAAGTIDFLADAVAREIIETKGRD